MDERQTCEAVRLFHAGVDALLSLDLSTLATPEVTGALIDVEVDRRRLEAVDQRLLAEVSQRGIAGEYGRTSPADLLVRLLRVAPREAKARVERSLDLGPRRAMTGEALEPICPAVAAAVAAGAISSGHADVLTGCLQRVEDLKPDAVPLAEELLLKAAGQQHPGELARTAALLLARLDPDGLEPKEDELERRRDFSLLKLADGSALPRGRWTPELVALWEPILDTLAAPTPASIENGEPPDPRSAGQRRHDAMAEAASRLLRSGSLPPAGGVPVTVLALTTMTELQQHAGLASTGDGEPQGPAGVAITGHGTLLSITKLLQMAAEAKVIPVVCTDTGGVLAYGRTRRLASTGQRLALAARDRGCCFPGCDRPAAWAEVHHVREWIDGGSTDLDNLCLLCRYHHRNFAKYGGFSRSSQQRLAG